jgi:hypothetical protein
MRRSLGSAEPVHRHDSTPGSWVGRFGGVGATTPCGVSTKWTHEVYPSAAGGARKNAACSPGPAAGDGTRDGKAAGRRGPPG